ncbi:SPOC domain-containing protein [Massariosphaeria phaeospora]|uniref:Transcription factor BYE1 n=1 Tax=Massariosphaeria phaeospora TaxID=100035 RepID=A0A7C8I3S5_9PLEO|nr:SPOC domain-containing protein [Massariosphaeria phaeospora]
MADEVRRSGRANKGHHTKNADALDEPLLPKPKGKQKGDKKGAPSQATTREESTHSAATQSVEQELEDEGEAIIRCVCGDQRDIRGRQMICCDKCEAWQHNRCLSLPEGDYWEDKTYYCEQCNPDDHKDLLAAMARGEKPWNRKKGSKAKTKARPSDVKTESDSVQPAGSTPQAEPSPTVQAHLPVPIPTPAQAQAATPLSVPKPEIAVPEPLADHTENKPSRKDALMGQPQSPLGEKRRHESIAEKESASKKRRKSSTQQHDKSAAYTPATDIEGLPEKQRLIAEMLKERLIPLIKSAADHRSYRIPDGATAKSMATKLTLQIDHAAILHFGEPSNNQSPYSSQLRSIMFNAKKNTVLVDRLLSGSLSPEDIVSMSAEEMASEEKQREYAAMREANEKQMVLTTETGPRLRKTHKGEEIVGEDNETASTHEFRPPEPRERESVAEENPLQPRSPARDGENQTVVELPEDIGQRAPLSVDTSTAPLDSFRRPSTTFDIKSVFNQVRSPHNDQKLSLQRRQSSIRSQEKIQQGPGDDADIDRLLKGEDDDVEMADYSDPSVVWQGTLDTQSLGAFNVAARFIAGGDFGQVIPWEQLLSPKLPIQGRIERQKGDEYIRGLASSGSHDVGVLAVTAVTAGDREIMDRHYNYFQSKNRWGVVPVDKLGNETMRDLYVIPIEAGGSPLPPFLDMLEYCTIETPRKEPMMLLALIAKLPEARPLPPPAQPYEQQPTEGIAASQGAFATPVANGSTNGPSPSPVTNPHAPQYSPLAPSFPPPHNLGGIFPPPLNNGFPPPIPPTAPQHHRIPKALEILGPFIDAPVVVNVLTSNPTIHEDQMSALRHIMEKVPAARADLAVFAEHMRAKNEDV